MNLTQSFRDAFGVEDITSEQMRRSFLKCYNMYYANEPDCNYDQAMAIPRVIVDGLEKPVFGEYEATVDEDTPKGKVVARLLQNFEKERKEAFTHVMIGGEGFIKPIPRRDNFVFGFISRPNMVVLARDFEGAITSLGTSEVTIKQEDRRKIYYTLLERRTVDDEGYLTIESRLYRTEDSQDICNNERHHKSSSSSSTSERSGINDLPQAGQ